MQHVPPNYYYYYYLLQTHVKYMFHMIKKKKKERNIARRHVPRKRFIMGLILWEDISRQAKYPGAPCLNFSSYLNIKQKCITCIHHIQYITGIHTYKHKINITKRIIDVERQVLRAIYINIHKQSYKDHIQRSHTQITHILHMHTKG